MADSQPLRFVGFSSAVETGFWHKMSQLKLERLRLSEEPVPISGSYSNGSTQGLPALFNIDYAAFDRSKVEGGGCPGLLMNWNTVDGFRECDKTALLRQQAARLWALVEHGTALASPSCLNSFLLLTFADLKKYDFLYWFCFPALKLPSSVVETAPPQTLGDFLTAHQETGLSLDAVASAVASQSQQPAFLLRLHPTLEARPLSDLTSAAGRDLLLTFRDPSTDPAHPGWPLRNLLALYWHYCGKDQPNVRILCFRDTTRKAVRSIGHSLVLSLHLSHVGGSSEVSAATGWERNERGNMGPRHVNLSATMDPLQLASTSVNLNLKLMRWRLVPDLDLDLMTSTRCLLLGAGTLGCNVARALLGWGVRCITLVDNGYVSFSNPVRQSLFTFQDSVERRHKAEAAAARLRDVFPCVESDGVRLSVPMPGHPVSEALQKQVLADVDRLTELVTSHDVIFLLMDSRESRWLPTLLGAAHQKVVLNAALGFDSYLVMRHGTRSQSEGATVPPADVCDPRSPIPGNQLGCYFCNDVVAPGNSLQDRTLDQQCTVTRPGVSQVAAGLVVEMMAALVQHPLRGEAPVPLRQEGADCAAGPLGGVPHSIRGFLGQLQQLTPATRAYNRCTACSSTVLQRYREDGHQFLLKVFNRSSYLEDITGLTELHRLTEAAELWELDDDDCDDF